MVDFNRPADYISTMSDKEIVKRSERLINDLNNTAGFLTCVGTAYMTVLFWAQWIVFLWLRSSTETDWWTYPYMLICVAFQLSPISILCRAFKIYQCRNSVRKALAEFVNCLEPNTPSKENMNDYLNN